MPAVNTDNARTASKSLSNDNTPALVLYFDHIVNIQERAKAYQGPDNGDVTGLARLKQNELVSLIHEKEGELDELDVEQVILDAQIAKKEQPPASYHAQQTPPANDLPDSIPSLIHSERKNARDMRKAMLIATSSLVTASFIMGVEITLLSEVLGYGMPEVAGKQSMSNGLLALAFTSVVAGAYFAIEKAGPRMTAVLDRLGAGAVLAYLLGAGVALGLKGSGLIGALGGPDLSQGEFATDWSDPATSVLDYTANSIVDTLGSAALAVALAMITVLSVIAIEHLLRIGLKHAGLYLSAHSAVEHADTLETSMTRIASGQLRLSREIEHLNEALDLLAQDTAAEINSLAAPDLRKAEEQLEQMRIVEASRPCGFDMGAFEARVSAFRAEIEPARLATIIEQAIF